MNSWPQPRSPRWRPVRLGLATHDDRFVRPILAALEESEAVVCTDRWRGHRLHHLPVSRSVADWSEVVVAEWCLGNAVWHSRHRRRDARVIVRLHRFELETDFPRELDMDGVTCLVFVGPHIREQAIARFGLPREKCLFIPNGVDTAAFDRPKGENARFTLGLLTWHRQLKRLDLALDLLEALRIDEPRFRLRIKGPRPEDIEHVWKYDSERTYFIAQYERIERSANIRDAVIFDPPGDDVPSWFSQIGYVLSLSDVESFHLALAEGMASRATPIIRDRPGVRSLFGGKWVSDDVAGAAKAVGAQLSSAEDWKSDGDAAHRWITDHYDTASVMDAWQGVLVGASGRIEAAGG